MIKSANFLLIIIFILQTIIGFIFNSGNFSYLFNIIISQVFAILIPIFCFKMLNKKRKFRIKQGKFKNIHIIIAILTMFSINIIAQYVNIPMISILTNASVDMPIDYVPNGVFEFFAYFVLIAFVPAILEEVLFREIVLNEYRGVYGDVKAIVLSGLAFSLLHLNPVSFIPQFLIGMFLSYLTVKTGGILLSVICHFAQNASLVIMRKFFYDESVHLLENNILLNSIASLVILLFGIYVIGRSLKTKPNTHSASVDGNITTSLYFIFVSIVLAFSIILN